MHCSFKENSFKGKYSKNGLNMVCLLYHFFSSRPVRLVQKASTVILPSRTIPSVPMASSSLSLAPPVTTVLTELTTSTSINVHMVSMILTMTTHWRRRIFIFIMLMKTLQQCTAFLKGLQEDVFVGQFTFPLKHKDAKIFENHLDPVMLVFIG